MKRLFRDIRVSLPIILVAALTLLLLSYVGFWEASRQYSQFQVSKLATQGEIIKNSVETYLNAGLPIEQYSSFHQLSEALLKSDKTIEHLSIINTSDKLIFFNRQPLSEKILKPKQLKEVKHDLFQQKLSQRQYKLSESKLNRKPYQIKESPHSIKVTLTLKGKFGKTGFLIIEADKTAMLQPFEKQYHTVFITYVLLILFFSFFAIIYEHFYRHSNYKRAILKTVYAISFLAMSGVILAVVFQIYEQGAQSNARALTDSMVSRLNSVLELGIKIDDISGINAAFTEYKKSNPDIREISLIEDGVCKYNTNHNLIGKAPPSSNDVYQYLIKLNSPDNLNRELFVSVSLPVDLVHKAILSSANEFITLVIACSLISLIFIDAGTGISNLRKTNNQDIANFHIGLSIIKPAYFLIVFVHALSVSFLPSLVTELATSSHSFFASNSLPFTLYYALFALVLIPAGQYAEKGSLKLIMVWGCLFEIMGLSLIILTDDYWWLILARMFSGAGQGFFLIGLQSFLLVVTPKEQRTQGAAIKVIGRNAGLISGTAIGALLFSFTDYTTVFLIGSVLSIMTLIYLWFLVPEVNESQIKTTQAASANSANVVHNIFHVFKDSEFVKSLILIAIPGKMAITGVIMFATPLLLTKHGFKAGEIGQALMLYYIASIIMTHYASRLVDHLDMSRFILFMSTVIGGISIIFLGFSDIEQWNGSLAYLGGEQITQLAIAFNQFLTHTDIQWLSTGVIMSCLILAGISNGLLTSPVVTHISNTPVAEQYGIKSVTATYTFLERTGHMLGPLVIGSLLTMAMQSNIALSFFGIVTIILGIIFVFSARKV